MSSDDDVQPCLCYTQYLTTNSQSPECSWARGQQRRERREFRICGNGPWPLGGRGRGRGGGLEGGMRGRDSEGGLVPAWVGLHGYCQKVQRQKKGSGQ